MEIEADQHRGSGILSVKKIKTARLNKYRLKRVGFKYGWNYRKTILGLLNRNFVSIALFLGTLGTRAGGMETYETHFLRALAAQDKTASYDVYCLRKEAEEMLGVHQPNFKFTILPAGMRAIDIGICMPMMLAFSRAKLLHPTYIPPAFCARPYVYTVHSSVTWVHPEFYPRWIRWRLNSLQEKGIREARVLLCVSEHVKNFIHEHFKIPEERLMVVYHGVSPDFKIRNIAEVRGSIKARHGIDYPYFLYAGKLTQNKNIAGLLKAFEVFRNETRSDIRLVLAGRRLWSEGELDAELDKAVASGTVVELGHLEHTDLPLLYNGAEGLVFPSLWEGFGLPILEAYASGIPVLTSNHSSLPEVAAGHSILVDCKNIESMAEGMKQLSTDSAQRRHMIAGGLERVREFTWERTARETRAAYQRALAIA